MKPGDRVVATAGRYMGKWGVVRNRSPRSVNQWMVEFDDGPRDMAYEVLDSHLEVVPGQGMGEDTLDNRQLAGRVMTRLNKLRVVRTDRQQMLLREAQDYLDELLQRLHAEKERKNEEEL